MWYRCRRRPRVAMALVAICALLSLFQFQRNAWRAQAAPNRTVAEQLVARYEPLRPLVPTTTVTRLWIDERHVDSELMNPAGRLYLAQYALSPRRVTNYGASRWVIVESDCPGTVPEAAAAAHWTLLADLRNGVRLYRTDAKE